MWSRRTALIFGLVVTVLAAGLTLLLRTRPPDEPPLRRPCTQTAGCADPLVALRPATQVKWDCAGQPIVTCHRDYLAFPDRARDQARPTNEAAWREQLRRIRSGKELPLTTYPSPPELSKLLIEALNIGFLLDGLDRRELTVAVTGRSPVTNGYCRENLLFSDPYLGTWPAILLTPVTPGPHAAVIGLHGHGSSAESFIAEYGGGTLAGRGYAVLIPGARALGGTPYEDEVARRLLTAGFTFEGLRVYEVLLAAKFLRCREHIAAERIGLLGHSEGSVTANLAARVQPFGAAVVDHTVNFLESGDGNTLVASTTPALWRYHRLLNQFDTTLTPTLVVPYGYRGRLDAIAAFLSQAMVFTPR